MSERFPQEYDPRGLNAKCVGCGKPFYIPWETMCDAGYCDACMNKKPKRAAPKSHSWSPTP